MDTCDFCGSTNVLLRRCLDCNRVLEPLTHWPAEEIEDEPTDAIELDEDEEADDA